MLMRVAVGIHGDDVDSAIETYDLMSQRWFTHATPTLFNAGTPTPQMSSCFLLAMKGDSIEGIYDTLRQTALISKSAGGIGLAAHCIRATGSYIKGTNGTSNGLVPMLKVFNETARYADVIFPAACFAEKDGVFTNSERRVQLVRKGVEPPGQAKADWRIIMELANACGADWHYEHPREIYAELANGAPKFAGISHERIDERGEGLQWPCVDADDPGTTYLHEGRVLRGDGRGLFQAVEYRPSAEQPDDDYPLVVSTGRTLYHYNAATQTRRAPGLDEKQPTAFIEIHPRDARKRGIEHGDLVDVSSRRGHVRVHAILSRQVKRGCIWMPLHFPDARANLLTNDAGDEVTGTAEYKVCAAQVVKVDAVDKAVFPGSYYYEAGPGPGAPD